MSMKSFLLLGCFAAMALVITGCGRAEEKTASAELPVLRKAPAWTLKDVDGREVKAADFKGKVIVVDFWATWCPPCRKEIPEYIAMQEKYRAQGLVILGFSLDELPSAEVKGFGQMMKVNYPLIMADAATAESFGEIQGLPTAFVIDREGNIRHVKLGLADPAAYEKLIASLL
jgi:peroxiredoxin